MGTSEKMPTSLSGEGGARANPAATAPSLPSSLRAWLLPDEAASEAGPGGRQRQGVLWCGTSPGPARQTYETTTEARAVDLVATFFGCATVRSNATVQGVARRARDSGSVPGSSGHVSCSSCSWGLRSSGATMGARLFGFSAQNQCVGPYLVIGMSVHEAAPMGCRDFCWEVDHDGEVLDFCEGGDQLAVLRFMAWWW